MTGGRETKSRQLPIAADDNFRVISSDIAELFGCASLMSLECRDPSAREFNFIISLIASDDTAQIATRSLPWVLSALICEPESRFASIRGYFSCSSIFFCLLKSQTLDMAGRGRRDIKIKIYALLYALMCIRRESG